MAIATLATTRYVEVGTYIGQFFLAGAGSLPNEARVVCLVGRGDRNLMIRNNTIRRSFVYDEQLTFTTVAPFIADLNFPTDGNQSSPTSLRTGDGVEISANKWAFVLDMGEYQKLQLVDSVYDPMAQYFLSYQSTSREVIDPIPAIKVQQLQAVAEIREIQALGTLQDQQEFEEYKDYVGICEIDPPLGVPSNSNPSTGFSTINISGVSGTGTLLLNPSALYSHSYNRVYSIECTATGVGVTPNRTADFKWTSTPVSFGNNALPSVPLNPAEDAPTFTLDETDTGSYTQLLELGVLIDLDFGASNFTVGDVFYFQGNGTSLIEIDPKLLNTNQFTDFSAITPSLMPLSTGAVSYNSLPSAYVYTEHNLSFRLKVISAINTSPTRQATIAWAGYGTFMASGSFTIDEASPTSLIQPLGASGISLEFSFGATHFVVDDMFSFIVAAPRIFYKGKEAVRNTKFTVGAVTYPTGNRTVVAGGYVTDTPEGRFGNWQADTNTNQGRFEIPDGLRFYVRNAYLSTLVNPIPSGSRLNTGDIFNMQARFLNGLDFSLLREETQTFSNPSEIATDTAGAITGTVGARYITLGNMPVEILSLLEVSTSDPVAYVQIAGTPYLVITEVGFSVSNGDLIANYRWRGAEPAPGQIYYLSAKYLRPAEFYNRPFLFLSKTDTETFLAPSTVRNDLYIGSQIAWDYAIPGLFVIQVKDADDDGVYSREDFKLAVNAFLQDRRATDLVVLNFFSVLPDQLQIINIANDPFELHESMTWIGTPIGTPIGSEIEIGSLVFLARKTLAVYGQSPAHGTRVLVGSTRATKAITLDDKSTTTVTLDGSFVAAALSALNSSFADPKATLLFKQITSFDTMQTYTNPENMMLGGNNIIFFGDEGSGIYRIKEDITTDPFSPDTLNINQMVQKQFVTRDIRRIINNSLISMVFPTASSGVITLQAILVSRLGTLVGNNLIGQYQNASGDIRDLDPSADALVFRDLADPTLFHIGYNYFLATTAKRVYGLYTVNLSGGFPK
jgi:hypothetical protein